MKKGFTLIEMLIVVVVLVTLMSITFKLGSINESSTKRNTTINRLQRLENSLSGYYAAFGTYPPVKLHGVQDPYLEVSMHGIQKLDGQSDPNIWGWNVEKFRKHVESDFKKHYQSAEDKAWKKVEAACRAQPFGCCSPSERGNGDFVKAQSEQMMEQVQENADIGEDRRQQLMAGFDDGVSDNRGRYQNADSSDWRKIQLFKFGLMSYLLPRFLVMTQSEPDMYDDFAQWTENNTLPFDPIDGKPFASWRQFINYAQSDNRQERMRIENIPSQAACARWLPNLEEMLNTRHDVKEYGINLQNEDGEGYSIWSLEIWSPGGDSDSTGGQYILDEFTARDGWGTEFFYYSPPPHQSYVLWSAGQNKRTFPPWISREGLNAEANKHIAVWIEDDIVNMRN